MELYGNPAIAGFEQDTRNLVMACYVASLAAGHTLLAISIKVDTIRRYLVAAKSFSFRAKLMDPTLTMYGKQARDIKAVLDEATRWEKVPNRAEPVTPEMVDYVIDKANEAIARGEPHHLYVAIADWLIMGLQSGFRKSEWAQDLALLRKTKDVQRNVDGTAKAFIRKDLTFRGPGERRITRLTMTSLATAVSVGTTWRYQKNGDNGQEMTYVRDTENPRHCYVSAARRIVKRALALQIPEDMPMGVFCTYRTQQGSRVIKEVVHFDDSNINKVLREAAGEVYNITDPEELKKFTAHSSRVGACVLLHAAGKDPEYIKYRLRWRSDSWKVYLRNVTALAVQHLQALRTRVHGD